MTEYQKEQLMAAVQKYALEVKPEGEFFTLKSGAKSKYYLDCRNLNLSPDGLIWVVNAILNEMETAKVDAFGGPTLGADPIVGGMAYRLGLNSRSTGQRGFLVRKESKDHGKAGRIVGPLKPGDRCAIVEDVCTSGQSAMDAIEAVEAFGAKVTHVFCIVDRMQGGAELFASKGIIFKPLLTIKDFGL